MMDRIKSAFARGSALPADEREYAPLTRSTETSPLRNSSSSSEESSEDDGEIEFEDGGMPFSWLDYSIFVLLGVAMLWAWNMFLAAAPYFQTRFASSPTLTTVFQPLILAVSTLTNLSSMILLQNMQTSASYPFRISMALALSTATFALLTLSTVVLTAIPPAAYLVFVLAAVACSAMACGLIQNGAFALAASFGKGEYMQALMVGQGIAGVLPPIAEVLSVLLVPGGTDGMQANNGVESESNAHMSGAAAFIYFLMAVLVSLATLIAFAPLGRRHTAASEMRAMSHMASSIASLQEAELHAKRTTSMTHLFSKLHWHACTLFTCFALSMFYPVLTTRILSVHRPSSSPSIFQPAAFIPLGFLFWNLGDLIGRLSTALPPMSALGRYFPRLLLVASLVRIAFLPLYGLCNLDGEGATISSDIFYLVVVQMGFGLTNGWVGSNCMVAAADFVEEDEREAAGGFMGLCLVAGLAAGSLMSFLAAALF